jgi:hypothetical protein
MELKIHDPSYLNADALCSHSPITHTKETKGMYLPSISRPVEINSELSPSAIIVTIFMEPEISPTNQAVLHNQEFMVIGPAKLALAAQPCSILTSSIRLASSGTKDAAALAARVLLPAA